MALLNADERGMASADPIRIVILGNAGSGKSTLAHRIADERGVSILALDAVAWEVAEEPTRRPFLDTVAEMRAFIDDNDEWVIEGCYADLVEAALPHCSELVFLNPGVRACVERARGRRWEPDKFASPEEQDQALSILIEWIGEYETRLDEYGLRRHRAVFEAFTGPKRELTTTDAYASRQA